MSDGAAGILFFVCIGLGALIGGVIASTIQLENARKRAVTQCAAEYTTDSGTFQWTDDRVRFIVEGDK